MIEGTPPLLPPGYPLFEKKQKMVLKARKNDYMYVLGQKNERQHRVNARFKRFWIFTRGRVALKAPSAPPRS